MNGLILTNRGHRLWTDHARAVRYAEVRHMMYGTRQRVVGELYGGAWVWRVLRAADPRPAGEPCS